MKTGNDRAALTLSMMAAFSAALSAGAGLFIPDLYTDNAFVKTAWYGNDWVTLVVVVPALLFILFAADKHSPKVHLLWTGLLAYLVYNYAFYLFGAAFNKIFLLYAAAVSLSLFALINGLAMAASQPITSSSKMVRWISAYLFLIAVMLCGVEIPPIINYISNGGIPDTIIKTNHPTAIVYAMDLPFIVPVMLLAAFLVWQNQTWGYILAALMLVKGFTYGLVLTVGTILLARQHIEDPLLPVWIFITAGGITGLILLFKKISFPVIAKT